MHAIEVDFGVLKALMAQRETESVTYNDVIRRLLELDRGLEAARVPVAPASVPACVPATVIDAPGLGAWSTNGVTFPPGSEFRATYKGVTYSGRVEAGRLVVNGKGYDSVSAAAGAITGGSVNGWIFWECRRPGESGWRVISGLRRRG